MRYLWPQFYQLEPGLIDEELVLPVEVLVAGPQSNVADFTMAAQLVNLRPSILWTAGETQRTG